MRNQEEAAIALRPTGKAPRLGRETSDDRHLRIYRLVRERISLLHYPPNTALSETELAGEFGVSRTPIRRVLQRLHFEGLVDIRNGIGTIVTDIDLKTMKEVYDLRMRLTDLMADLSPRTVTEEQLAAMEALLARTKELYGNSDPEGYGRLCNDLHEVMMSMIGSAPLREITDVFYYRVARIWFTFLPDLDWNGVITDQETEVAEMLAAMKRGDLRRVAEVRRIYLNRILSRVSSYLTGGHLAEPAAERTSPTN